VRQKHAAGPRHGIGAKERVGQAAKLTGHGLEQRGDVQDGNGDCDSYGEVRASQEMGVWSLLLRETPVDGMGDFNGQPSVEAAANMMDLDLFVFHATLPR
jgi:hypothetical protein